MNDQLNTNRLSKLLPLIFTLQALGLLILLKSVTLSALFYLMLLLPVIVYISPEIGVLFVATGNVLLYVLFDQLQLNIPAPVMIAHVLFLTLTILVIHVKYPDRRIPLDTVFYLTLALWFVLVLGVLYSDNRMYGMLKIVFFLVINLYAFFACLFLAYDRVKLKKFVISVWGIGFLLAFFAYIQPKSYLFEYVRYTVSESVNPIFLSRSLGISAVAGLYFAFRSRLLVFKVIYLVTLPLLIGPMIWTMSRGPLLGLLLSFLLYYLLQPSRPRWERAIVTLAGIGAALIFLVTSAGQIQQRMVTPIGEETSAAFRILAWIQALQDFAGSPLLGIGTGSFFMDTPWVPFIYPHNLVLEVLCENGIIGLGLLTAFLLLAWRRGIKALKSATSQGDIQLIITLLCMFAFALFNALFSGDIYKNEMIWVTAGLLVALYYTFSAHEKTVVDNL